MTEPKLEAPGRIPLHWQMFILSFTALFLELMVIRWVPSVVRLVAYYANLMLLSSFLGLGIQPPQPSWGNMIADGRDAIVLAPWVALSPGLALILTVLACTLLGDALRDRLAGEEMLTLRSRS